VADIVIVGGGVIGASIAYHLATAGASGVVLVERGAICSGETSKSGGFVQTHWDTLAEVRLIAYSRAIFADWANRIGGDCGYVRGGYLHVTGVQREPDVRRVHQMLVDEGLESNWIERADLAKLRIDSSGVVSDPQRRTTRKLRVVTSRNQQVARIDYEDDREVHGELESAIVAQIDRLSSADRADDARHDVWTPGATEALAGVVQVDALQGDLGDLLGRAGHVAVAGAGRGPVQRQLDDHR